ncbi:MAG: phenylalanine--tRNA ligase subunit beta [Candidatus Omnitrophota bacterium]
MKIPYSWLKDHVNFGTLKAEEVAEKLTIIGLEVVMIEKNFGDSIFDIEVTPNRPDCLSILGIAREAAASMNKKLKMPKAKELKAVIKEKPTIEIRDKKLCPRYTGRIIKNVKVAPSPKWLSSKLEKMDLRSVNNVVDVTNFCLFETGQPTHAFDYDKLKGRIIIRRARKDEKMVTIDGRERALDPDMLVIADEEKPIALAGVMGSKETEVTEKTKNILFESAYFEPISIRRTSRRLGLISESSYRFERSVDMGGIVSTSNKACVLIIELCGGKPGPIQDAGTKDPKIVKIMLAPEKVKRILGVDISDSAIKKALLSLQLDVEPSGKRAMVVSVPTFRQDLKTDVDLVEEIIRMYGYDRLKSTMPTIVGHPERVERPRELLNTTRDTLVALGLDEIITYSLVAKDEAGYIEKTKEEETIVIQNPLSIEQEIMRPTLIPGILHTVIWNLNRGNKDLMIFEAGRTYSKRGKHYKEEESLSIAFAGERGASWEDRAQFSFFDMKGVLEILFERLGVSGVIFNNEGFPAFLTGEAAAIEVSKEGIGFLGGVRQEVLDKFGIKTETLVCQISLDKLFKYVDLVKRFKEMPKFPSAKRDISIIIKKDVSYHTITSTMKQEGGELLENIELFDLYVGPQIPHDSRSLAYSIEYRAQDRTLIDDEVARLHGKVCDALVQKLGATIR